MIKDQSALEEETKDPDRYNAINFKQPKKLPRTLDELDKDPDFQLLLDVPTFKVLLGRLQWLNLPEKCLGTLSNPSHTIFSLLSRMNLRRLEKVSRILRF